jgi:hypothetical protein
MMLLLLVAMLVAPFPPERLAGQSDERSGVVVPGRLQLLGMLGKIPSSFLLR